MLSGLKDVDREILKRVDDKELVRVCSTDRKTWSEVCDDDFLKRRLAKYPGIEKYKRQNETWKQFFLRFIYYTSKLREEHQFEYTDGNFKKQYELLENYKGKWNDLLFHASRAGELSVVKYAVQNGADIHAYNDNAIRNAAEKGHLELVKFLVDKGANIHIFHERALRLASKHRHLEIVKYLVERGANVRASNDHSLLNAVINNDFPMVKYLVEHGANIHVSEQAPLKLAQQGRYSEIVSYLESLYK